MQTMLRHIWATSWQNQQNGMCAQWRLRSPWASAQSDQSLCCPHEESLGTLDTQWAHSADSDQTGRMPRLIWVFAGCTVILLVLSWGISVFVKVPWACQFHCTRHTYLLTSAVPVFLSVLLVHLSVTGGKMCTQGHSVRTEETLLLLDHGCFLFHVNLHTVSKSYHDEKLFAAKEQRSYFEKLFSCHF